LLILGLFIRGIDVKGNIEDIKSDLHTRFSLFLDGGLVEELERMRIPTENQPSLDEDMYLIYDVPRTPSLTDETLIFLVLTETISGLLVA